MGGLIRKTVHSKKIFDLRADESRTKEEKEPEMQVLLKEEDRIAKETMKWDLIVSERQAKQDMDEQFEQEVKDIR